MAYSSNYSTTYIQAYPPNYAQPSGDNFAVDAGKGILESSPYAKSLAELVNQTNLAANRNRLGTTGAATEDQLSQNIYRRSQGLLDPATEQMMQSRIAAMGGNRGMGVDSANLASAYYRALGETTQAQEEQALKDYATLQATTPAPVGMEQFLMTPGQYGSLQNERYKTNMNYLNNLLGLQNQVGMGGGYGYGRGRGSAAPGFDMWPQSTSTPTARTPAADTYTLPGYGTTSTDGNQIGDQMDMDAWMAEMGYDPFGQPLYQEQPETAPASTADTWGAGTDWAQYYPEWS